MGDAKVFATMGNLFDVRILWSFNLDIVIIEEVSSQKSRLSRCGISQGCSNSDDQKVVKRLDQEGCMSDGHKLWNLEIKEC